MESEEQKEKRIRKINRTSKKCGYPLKNMNICIMCIPERGGERNKEKVFEKRK